jgi:hypothetical protein
MIGISNEVLQAVLLDKTHVAMMAFHKFKKRINESSNRFVLFCYTKRYCGLQLLYHYVPTPVDKITVRLPFIQIKRNGWQSIKKRRHSNL